MKFKLLLTRAFLISLVSVVGFGLITLWIHNKRIEAFDQAIITFVQGFETSSLTIYMKVFTTIGSTPVVVVLSLVTLVLFYKFLNHRTELVLFITVIAGTAILNQVLKLIFQRARPSLHRIIEETGYSFPSGHSMEAVAFYGITTYLLWRHTSKRIGRVLLIIFSTYMIVSIGISRIYVGVHYPSDVIGAYFASLFLLTISIRYYQKYMERKK